VSLAPVIFVAPDFSSVWRIKDQSIVSSSSLFFSFVAAVSAGNTLTL
jgi:hypothetical protein